MKYRRNIFLSFFFMMILCGFVIADFPPGPVNETQRGYVDTLIDVVGIVTEESKVEYTISTHELETGRLKSNERLGIIGGHDSLRTSGGSFNLNKHAEYDTSRTGKVAIDKVLTYKSTEGAHLLGSDEWMVDLAGNYSSTADHIRCVFTTSKTEYIPAFCNVVKTKSDLVNINSGQISTSAKAAPTSSRKVGVNYQIAVTPDSDSGSGFADGTVKTLYAGSIMEARGKNQIPSATNDWKDAASVTGGITKFQKMFTYESGITAT